MTSLAPELERRESLKSRLERLFRSRPREWISMTDLALVGGVGGFRTRISELNLREKNPMLIEWNGLNGARSAHRYVPYVPLGPSADAPRERRLF